MVERGAVHARLDEAGREQGADLGGERHAPTVAPPVERLHAEGVPGGHQALLAFVPERKGEDAVEVPHAVEAVLLVRMHDHLAVRVRRPAVAASLEALAQLAVVVDLAVDDRGHAAVLGVERLIAARDVDDGQPGVSQRERPDAPQRIAIRTAVAQRLDHPLRRVLARRAGRIEDCSDPAHGADDVRAL